MTYLDKIDMNKTYKVLNISSKDLIKRRFMDIGLVRGSKIKKVLESPFKGICAYNIMGTNFAIRNKEASKIEVEEDV